MVSAGDPAPDVSGPLANGDIGSFSLADRLDEAPLVLAFFPGAFTSVCTSEMRAFQEDLEAFEEIGATVFGVSVDTPFSLNEFREQNGLDFGLISDMNQNIIEAFDVSMDFESLGVYDVAKRAVFVVDGSGTVTYAWVSDDPGVEPNYNEIREAAAEAA